MEVDGGDGCVTPTLETVQSGDYTPLSRPLFIYPSGEALQRPEMAAFVEFYLDNSQSIAEQALFVPITAEQTASRTGRARRDRSAELRRPPSKDDMRGRDDTDGPSPGPLEGLEAGSRRYREKVIVGSLFPCAALSIVVTVGIVLALVVPSVEFFGAVSPRSSSRGRNGRRSSRTPSSASCRCSWARWSSRSSPRSICLPLGLLAAIYLSEYAARRTRSFVKPILEILAGIPTVVYGFFALTFVTPLLRENWPFGTPPGVFNALSAGLVMGIMILPTVASHLRGRHVRGAAVPARRCGRPRRHASYEISTRVVVPAALSGIIAAFVLGHQPGGRRDDDRADRRRRHAALTLNPAEAMQTMTAFIGAAGLGDQSTGSIGYKTIFAVGITLFVMTLVMNIISIRLVRKYREVYD